MRGHFIRVHIPRVQNPYAPWGSDSIQGSYQPRFPIRLDVIGQAVAKGQILNIRRPMAVRFLIVGLFPQLGAMGSD